MGGFLDRLLRRNKVVLKENDVRTDLLLDDKELSSLVRRAKKLIIEVDAEMSRDDTQLFYRNLIKINVLHKFDKADLTFVVFGERGDIMGETLQSRGFQNVILKKGVVEEGFEGCSEVVLEEFCVAGLQYNVKESDKIWDEIRVNDVIELRAEPDNEHDSNAVAIFSYGGNYTVMQSEEASSGETRNVVEGLRLGYIPRTHNAAVAALLRAGWGDIMVAKVTKVDCRASYNARLQVTVFLKDQASSMSKPAARTASMSALESCSPSTTAFPDDRFTSA